MSPFSPATHRSSSVVILRHERWQRYRIVTSLATRSSTEVLEVDATASGGALLLAANHVFPDEASALEAQTQSGFQQIARGSALLGYVAAASQGGILLATRVAASASLPGGHTIHLVQEAHWVMLALDGLMSTEEERFWANVQQQNIGGTHYYCETADITRPFPSSHPPTNPRPEFVWNAWLAQPVVSLGLPYHCPALLQGAAESADQVHPNNGQRYSIALLSRRSRRHPGTRYNARGLNDLAGPGNEIEAELLMWTPSVSSSSSLGSGSSAAAAAGGGGGGGNRVNGGAGPLGQGLGRQAAAASVLTSNNVATSGSASSLAALQHQEQPQPTAAATAAAAAAAAAASTAVRWARVVWRRGTVPIRWGVEIQPLNKGLQAEVYVRDKGPYHGTLTYFRTLQQQCLADACGGGGGDGLNGHTNSSSSTGVATSASLENTHSEASAHDYLVSSSSIGRSSNADKAEEDRRCAPGAIVCINLLHSHPNKRAELMLSDHFQEGMLHVRERLKHQSNTTSVSLRTVNGAQPQQTLASTPSTPLSSSIPDPRLLIFDWHGTMGKIGEDRGIEAFWEFIEQPVKQAGFALGEMIPRQDVEGGGGDGDDDGGGVSRGESIAAASSPPPSETRTPTTSSQQPLPLACPSSSEDTTPWGTRWQMRWLQRQRGLLRYNCADSLDRTNAATCFAALPVLQEGLRMLGISLDVTTRPMRSATAAADTSGSGQIMRSSASVGGGGGGLAAAVARGGDGGNFGSFGLLTGASANSGNTSAGCTTTEQVVAPSTASSAATARATNAAAAGEEEEEIEVLPDGWQRTIYKGRVLYLDHENHKTYWEPPEGTTYKTANVGVGGAAAGAAGAGAATPSTPPRNTTTNTFSASQLQSSQQTTTPATKSPSNSSLAPAGQQHRQQQQQPSSSSSPPPGQPWGFFSYTLDDVRFRLYPDALNHYVSMFRRHGDVHSALYTGSPAMHSHVLGLVLNSDARPYGGASAGVGKLQNLRVAVQRRWNNTVSDAARQASIEVSLGMNVVKHCPGVVLPFNPDLNDLYGPDHDDVDESILLNEEDNVHKGAELESLHMLRHDGRVGLTEDLTHLESLSGSSSGGGDGEDVGDVDVDNSGSGFGGFSGGGVDYKNKDSSKKLVLDDDVGISDAFDPLGAVKRPASGEGGSADLVGQMRDLLL